MASVVCTAHTNQLSIALYTNIKLLVCYTPVVDGVGRDRADLDP